MKKIFPLIIILLTIFFAHVDAFAGNYQNITSNPTISSSLNALQSINRGDVISILNGANQTGKPIRVMFRDLTMFGLANCEAVTMKTQSGGLVIYINKKHQSAPVEAIACLIAHESQHHTQTGTKQEELKAWIKEVSTWNAFVRKDKTLAYSTSRLVKRLNYLDKLYVRDNQGSQGIEKVIAGIEMYKGLN